MVSNGRDLSISYWQTKSIQDALDEGFSTIRNEDSFWGYVNYTLGPQLFTNRPLSELFGLSQSTRGAYLTLIQQGQFVVGTIRIQSIRALPIECTRELDPTLNLTSTCYSYRVEDSNLQTSTLYSAGMDWGTF